ncbi:hypothetical protein [Kribbella qitaiheensis]|uniref:hypothetical protein n=1 Tax=Kribbella qitaiheensis TaxID=1544730 RepID=UPI001FE79723|nr:hypothetical protein [Kribbella qitaiheensis]
MSPVASRVLMMLSPSVPARPGLGLDGDVRELRGEVLDELVGCLDVLVLIADQEADADLAVAPVVTGTETAGAARGESERSGRADQG